MVSRASIGGSLALYIYRVSGLGIRLFRLVACGVDFSRVHFLFCYFSCVEGGSMVSILRKGYFVVFFYRRQGRSPISRI